MKTKKVKRWNPFTKVKESVIVVEHTPEVKRYEELREDIFEQLECTETGSEEHICLIKELSEIEKQITEVTERENRMKVKKSEVIDRILSIGGSLISSIVGIGGILIGISKCNDIETKGGIPDFKKPLQQKLVNIKN